MTNEMTFLQHFQLKCSKSLRYIEIYSTGRAPQHASLEHDILTVRYKFYVFFSEFIERINSPLTTFFFRGRGKAAVGGKLTLYNNVFSL